MKKIKIFSLHFLAIMLFATACGEMSETYSEFVKNGETIYVGKADSIKTRGGKERVEISWLLLSDPSVTNYKIYWNNNQDSVMGIAVKTDNVDTIRVLLNDLPESVYNFDIFLFDDFKHSSIKASVVGRTYGEVYQSSILNRIYRSLKRVGTDDVEVEWDVPSEDLVSVEISYTNKSGVVVNKTIDRSVLKDTLINIPKNGEFKYRTAYEPEPNALDTFQCSYEKVTLKI